MMVLLHNFDLKDNIPSNLFSYRISLLFRNFLRLCQRIGRCTSIRNGSDESEGATALPQQFCWIDPSRASREH